MTETIDIVVIRTRPPENFKRMTAHHRFTELGREFAVTNAFGGVDNNTVYIHTVGDKESVGVCEGCGEPLLDGDEYHHDTEGVMWHKHERECNSA